MTEKTIRLTLTHAQRPDRLRATTLKLRGEIDDALGEDGTADLVRGEAPATEGAKGDPITLGVIVVALISSGAVKALIEKIFEHVKKQQDEIEVQTSDGIKVRVSATDLEDANKRAAVEDTIRRALAAVQQ